MQAKTHVILSTMALQALSQASRLQADWGYGLRFPVRKFREGKTVTSKGRLVRRS